MKQITPTHQRGATLIEVLVAIVILSVGLLGLAGLQTISVQSNYSAYYRSQASILAADITDRMRANRKPALAGAYNLTAFPASKTDNAITGTRAEQDRGEWLNNIAKLPEGTAKIEKAGDLFVISIRWNDTRGNIKAANGDSDTTQTFIYRTEI